MRNVESSNFKLTGEKRKGNVITKQYFEEYREKKKLRYLIYNPLVKYCT